MGIRRASVVLIMLSACWLLAGLFLWHSAAFGAINYPFVRELAPPSGSFNFIEPNGVAVDDGNSTTYVADAGVVYAFETASGTALANLDSSLTPAGSFGGGSVAVAANNGTGAIDVLDSTDDVIDEFSSAGAYVCQITGQEAPSATECNGIGGSDTPAHGFNAPSGIAVDQATGEIYVGDANNGVVDIFSSSGAYLRQIELAASGDEISASEPRGIAVDDHTGHVYVSNVAPAIVMEFDTTGAFLTTLTGANTPSGSFGEVAVLGVAVDNATGDLFVSETHDAVIDTFGPEGEYTGAGFGRKFTLPLGLTFGQAEGTVTVGDVVNNNLVAETFGPAAVIPDVVTGSASPIHPTDATLSGTVNPVSTQLTDCHFDYVPQAQFEASEFNEVTAAEEAVCVPAAASVPPDSSEHAVTAEVTGLEAGVTYHYRLQATNENGIPSFGQTLTFATPPRPLIEAASTTNVEPESATLNATINPEGSDTSYQFEWGTSTAYGNKTPASSADIGSGSIGVAVSAQLTGLSATTYHWRVVASNPSGTTTGDDHTFVYSQRGSGLPDGRAYEMVTPPHKNAALIGDITFGPASDIADNGSSLIQGSVQCFGDAVSCVAERQTNGSPTEFTRTPGGWAAKSLSPPASEFETNTWWQYDANSGTALFSMPTEPTKQDDFYARGPDNSFHEIGPISPPEGGANLQAVLHVVSIATTSDISHVVFSDDPLWPFSQSGPSKSLFEYVGRGQTEPALIGVTGGEGSTSLISACDTELGELNVLGTALSADGRTVYFTAGTCEEGTGTNATSSVPVAELYARIDNGEATAHTVAISQPDALPGGPPDESCTTAECRENVEDQANWRDAAFQRASTDGSKTFFTDTQQLTDDASQDPSPADSATSAQCPLATGANGCNLYLYDAANGASHALVDVSAGSLTAGGPRVQGVVAVAPDGSRVYFVAKGVLTAQANAQDQQPQDGANNMYVFERDAEHPSGRVAFISSLPDSDLNDWRNANDLANVTPDGRYLLFTSRGRLTSDVTRTDGADQVFRYDADSGQLIHISIGERGFNDNGNAATGDASIVPGLNGYRHAGVGRSDPTMSDNGAYVFFMSPVGLAPGALNDVQIGTDEHSEPIFAQNVYQYHEGSVSLISDGRDTGDQPAELCATNSSVCLLGTDTTGANVFFSTTDQLLPQDTDTQLDFYDARICTTSDPCIQPPTAAAPPCLGEACHGTPAAPLGALAPGSATFSGPGNATPPATGKAPSKPLTKAQKLAKALKACRTKRNKQKRASCEKQARKLYGVKQKAKSHKSSKSHKAGATQGGRK